MADAKAQSGKPKLYYFNGRGKAELARYLLAEAQCPYEDIRIDAKKDWNDGAKYKEKMPFGQVPVLEIPGAAGCKLAESAAIERHIARIGKLYGANELDAARIDMIVEGVHDAIKNWGAATRVKDDTEKKTKLDAYFKDEFPRWMGQLTTLLKANNGGGGYFVGTNASLADFTVFAALDHVVASNAVALAPFPELAGLLKRVCERPRIADWIKNRPKSDW